MAAVISVAQMLKLNMSSSKVSVADVEWAEVFGPRNDDSMGLICANWAMTCWSTEEGAKTALELITEGCILVSDRMLISILYMSVEALEMSDALAAQAEDLKPDNLLSPFCLMCHFKNLNLS